MFNQPAYTPFMANFCCCCYLFIFLFIFCHMIFTLAIISQCVYCMPLMLLLMIHFFLSLSPSRSTCIMYFFLYPRIPFFVAQWYNVSLKMQAKSTNSCMTGTKKNNIDDNNNDVVDYKNASTYKTTKIDSFSTFNFICHAVQMFDYILFKYEQWMKITV